MNSPKQNKNKQANKQPTKTNNKTQTKPKPQPKAFLKKNSIVWSWFRLYNPNLINKKRVTCNLPLWQGRESTPVCQILKRNRIGAGQVEWKFLLRCRLLTSTTVQGRCWTLSAAISLQTIPTALTRLILFSLMSLEPKLNGDMPFGVLLNDLVSHSLDILNS